MSNQLLPKTNANKFHILLLAVVMICCTPPIHNKSQNQASPDSAKSNTKFIDTRYADLKETDLEAPKDVYTFINNLLTKESKNEICNLNKEMNTLLTVSLDIEDSIITDVLGRYWSSHDGLQLDTMVKNYRLIEEVFDQEKVSFDFMEGDKSGYYSFRVELDTLCAMK